MFDGSGVCSAVEPGVALGSGVGSVVTPGSVILSMTISCMTGIVFGLYPARRAASVAPASAAGRGYLIGSACAECSTGHDSVERFSDIFQIRL